MSRYTGKLPPRIQEHYDRLEAELRPPEPPPQTLGELARRLGVSWALPPPGPSMDSPDDGGER